MEWNHPGTNPNTPFFREFVSSLNLVIMNTLPVSKGSFTHFMERPGCPPSESVLDYGLIDNQSCELVSSFAIDADARFLCGTDHSMLTVTLQFGVINRVSMRMSSHLTSLPIKTTPDITVNLTLSSPLFLLGYLLISVWISSICTSLPVLPRAARAPFYDPPSGLPEELVPVCHSGLYS